MRRSLQILSILLLGAGCTHRHTLGGVPANVYGKRVTIRTAAGRSLRAYAAPTATGVVWHAEDGTELAARDVTVVTSVNRVRGMGEGTAIGALIGAGVGAVAGLASGDDPPCEGQGWFCFRSTAGEKAMVGAILLGSGGVVIGGLAGVIHGSHDEYELSPREAAPRVMVVPTRDGGALNLAWAF